MPAIAPPASTRRRLIGVEFRVSRSTGMTSSRERVLGDRLLGGRRARGVDDERVVRRPGQVHLVPASPQLVLRCAFDVLLVDHHPGPAAGSRRCTACSRPCTRRRPRRPRGGCGPRAWGRRRDAGGSSRAGRRRRPRCARRPPRPAPGPSCRRASRMLPCPPCAPSQVPPRRLLTPRKPATKRVVGRSYSVSGSPSCSYLPLFITAIRSDIVIASSWSWVT